MLKDVLKEYFIVKQIKIKMAGHEFQILFS